MMREQARELEVGIIPSPRLEYEERTNPMTNVSGLDHRHVTRA
jgi:hypothetical protein